ncbi:hypothetical protein RISK_000875 [Rhodopirellula islandica]|uniref:Uncharacterized protein n=1 Tax=Rhodopirellula islandica TaxID=595434 RepID=A0A0J1ENI6_RHOIS|nr:hypothetical protein RISK_000875 [Rhodopirellula islandica]
MGPLHKITQLDTPLILVLADRLVHFSVLNDGSILRRLSTRLSLAHIKYRYGENGDD